MYKLQKSKKGESGVYQIIEEHEDYQNGRCCGVYFSKKSAIEQLKLLTKNKLAQEILNIISRIGAPQPLPELFDPLTDKQAIEMIYRIAMRAKFENK